MYKNGDFVITADNYKIHQIYSVLKLKEGHNKIILFWDGTSADEDKVCSIQELKNALEVCLRLLDLWSQEEAHSNNKTMNFLTSINPLNTYVKLDELLCNIENKQKKFKSSTW